MNTPSIPAKTLALGILSTDYNFTLNDILSWDGVNNLTSSDFGPTGYAVFFNASRTIIEFTTFDPTTIANPSITLLTRGNDYKGGTVDGIKTKYDWNGNETYVMLGSNPPALFSHFMDINTVQTITAQKIFSVSPQVPDPVNPTDVVNLETLQATAIAGGVDASTATKGITKLTATPMTNLGTCTITIASPAVITLNSHNLIAGDTVQFTTTGTLPTGITAGTKYYVIAAGLTTNAFEISASLGGSPVVTTGSQSGTQTLYRTTPFAVSPDDVILVGTSGAKLSSTNHPIDQADSSGTGPVARTSLLTSIIQLSESIIAAANITAGQALVAWFYQSDGGIKLDVKNTTNWSVNSNPTLSITTGNNLNRILYVNIMNDADTLTAITYNSVAMTLLKKQTINGTKTQYIYYLLAPTIGANTLSMSYSGSANGVLSYSIYYNASQGAPEASGFATGSGTAVNSVTTISNGAMVIAFGANYASGAPTSNITSITNGGNNFQSGQNTGVTFAVANGDSGVLYPAGIAVSQTVNGTGSGTVATGIYNISIAPATLAVEAVTPASSVSVTLGQNKYDAFVGFAASSVSAGANASLIVGGVLTTTGLTSNSKYYLNDTPGVIGTSPGTNTRKVGISLASTQLLITNIW